jgi:phage regulator Rha-like protein
VLTNIDANLAAGSISEKLGDLLLKKISNEDASSLELAKGIFKNLQQGKLNRALFSENCNAYYSANAVQETRKNLAQFGSLKSFELSSTKTRGGMKIRRFTAVMTKKTLKIVVMTLTNGAIEQFTLAPQ